eukprot:1433665-Lingulodinium_polyedra.AAC.1
MTRFGSSFGRRVGLCPASSVEFRVAPWPRRAAAAVGATVGSGLRTRRSLRPRTSRPGPTGCSPVEVGKGR